MEEGNEARVVMADAQFGIASIMRPRSGFQATYQGLAATAPIYLFPEGLNVDQASADGLPGYAPNLARGLKVPLGARLLLWVPNLFYMEDEDQFGYRITPIWRLRTVADFINSRAPYHFARDRGASDTTAPVGQQARLPIPAAYNTLGYIQTEPATQPGRAITNVHSEDLEFSTNTLLNPQLSGGAEQPIQQGIVNPGIVAEATRPQFMVHDLQALGDELILALWRDDLVSSSWDFATTDLRVAQFLGDDTPNVGVYVFSGTAP